MSAAYFSLVCLAVVVLACIFFTARRQRLTVSSVTALAGVTRAVDIEAFCNLVDPDEDAFLQSSLPAAEYRVLKRERLLTAIVYVRAVSGNAAVLLRLGDAVR